MSERPMCPMCFALADESCRLASDPDRCVRSRHGDQVTAINEVVRRAVDGELPNKESK